MARKTDTDNPDTLTPEQQGARDAGLSEAPAEPPAEVSKGEFTDTVLHEGIEYPRGTKASAVKPKLTDEEKSRLKDLGLITGSGDADK
jgi:hypothetical protein